MMQPDYLLMKSITVGCMVAIALALLWVGQGLDRLAYVAEQEYIIEYVYPYWEEFYAPDPAPDSRSAHADVGFALHDSTTTGYAVW